MVIIHDEREGWSVLVLILNDDDDDDDSDECLMGG